MSLLYINLNKNVKIMAVFRKRPAGFAPPAGSVTPINSLEKVEEIVNGTPVVKEVIVPMSETDYHQRHPIQYEEFTLAQEVRAGVPLKEVPTSTLLDSGDNLDYEVNDIAEEKVLDALEQTGEK